MCYNVIESFPFFRGFSVVKVRKARFESEKSEGLGEFQRVDKSSFLIIYLTLLFRLTYGLMVKRRDNTYESGIARKCCLAVGFLKDWVKCRLGRWRVILELSFYSKMRTLKLPNRRKPCPFHYIMWN